MGFSYWNDTAVRAVVKAAAVRGMEQTMDEITLATQPVTPRKTGRLIVSRRGQAKDMGDVIRGRASFGGGNAKYAPVQEQGWMKRNEKIIYFRNYTTPGTGAHYLRNTFRTMIARPDFLRHIKREIGAALRRSP